MANAHGEAASTPLAPVPKPKCLVLHPCSPADVNVADRSKNRLQILREVLIDTFEVVSAEALPLPGDIPAQALAAIIEADLVVADLTDMRPSVFYELALRHVVARPVIQVLSEGSPEDLPVYARNQRTVVLDPSNPLGAKEQLRLLLPNLDHLQPHELTPLPTELRDAVRLALRDVSASPGPAGPALTADPPVLPPGSSARQVTRGAIARRSTNAAEAVRALEQATALRASVDDLEDTALRDDVLRSARELERDAVSLMR